MVQVFRGLGWRGLRSGVEGRDLGFGGLSFRALSGTIEHSAYTLNPTVNPKPSPLPHTLIP